MRKYIILLLLSLLIPTVSFSQDILPDTIRHRLDNGVLINPHQLKTANLIFIEHQKLCKENQLLYEQLDNYKELYETSEKIDSLYLIQLDEQSASCTTEIEQLNDVIKKKERIIKGWKIGSISVAVCLVAWLIFK